MTKIEQLKQHLLRGRKITNRESVERFNYFRLSDGVHKLRKAPYFLPIRKDWASSKTARWAVYSIEKGNKK